jgi:hypothetical protein
MCPTPTLQVGEVIPGRFRQSNGWTILCAGPVAIARAAATEFATGAAVGSQRDRVLTSASTIMLATHASRILISETPPPPPAETTRSQCDSGVQRGHHTAETHVCACAQPGSPLPRIVPPHRAAPSSCMPLAMHAHGPALGFDCTGGGSETAFDVKHPARPYKSAIQTRFTTVNTEGA